jgi:hypothetical protein
MSRIFQRSIIFAIIGYLSVATFAHGGPCLSRLQCHKVAGIQRGESNHRNFLALRGGDGEDQAGLEHDVAALSINQDGNAEKQSMHESEPWLKELEEKLKAELGEDGKPLSKNELKRRLKTARVEREREEKKEKQRAAAKGACFSCGNTCSDITA